MLRCIVLLGVALGLAGCGASFHQAQAELKARQTAELEARKIPEVQLTPAQLDALPKGSRARVAWARAGIQKDGRTFVCYVTSGRDLFGTEHAAVFTGTFEADGSFARNDGALLGAIPSADTCQSRGFDPPVRTVTTVTVVRGR